MAKNLSNENGMAMPKLPPQSVEAEQSVLGSVLLDKDAIIKIADLISPDDFYRDDHKNIYMAMLSLFEKRMPIDVVTISDELENKGQFEAVGGATYLTTLVNSVPTASHITHYAEIVQQKATLRRLLSAANRITSLGYDEDGDMSSVLDQAEQSLFAVSQKYLKQNFIPIREILSDTFERIDELHKNKGVLRGVPTGFRDLDGVLSGFQDSDLIIIAARPSMGKTAIVTNIAAHAAIKEKRAVGFFALEMSRDQLADRLISLESGVDSWKIRTGQLSDEDFPKIGYAMGTLSEASLYIDDSPSLNIMEIRSKCRRLQMEHGLDLVVVDYLQLMEGRSRGGENNRVQEISEISRSLKTLARELNVPVVALSQLSRAVEARPDKRPMLSDLRESGSIEQDADVVIFIYRDDYYHKDSERKGITELLVRKHRNGPIGDVELMFIPEQTRFRTIERKQGSSPAPSE
jgi:replicative DNA helicase